MQVGPTERMGWAAAHIGPAVGALGLAGRDPGAGQRAAAALVRGFEAEARRWPQTTTAAAGTPAGKGATWGGAEGGPAKQGWRRADLKQPGPRTTSSAVHWLVLREATREREVRDERGEGNRRRGTDGDCLGELDRVGSPAGATGRAGLPRSRSRDAGDGICGNRGAAGGSLGRRI